MSIFGVQCTRQCVDVAAAVMPHAAAVVMRIRVPHAKNVQLANSSNRPPVSVQNGAQRGVCTKPRRRRHKNLHSEYRCEDETEVLSSEFCDSSSSSRVGEHVVVVNASSARVRCTHASCKRKTSPQAIWQKLPHTHTFSRTDRQSIKGFAHGRTLCVRETRRGTRGRRQRRSSRQ